MEEEERDSKVKTEGIGGGRVCWCREVHSRGWGGRQREKVGDRGEGRVLKKKGEGG